MRDWRQNAGKNMKEYLYQFDVYFLKELVGGVKVDQPNWDLVPMRHWPPRAIRSFLPYMDYEKEEFVSVLPIGRIDREELVEIFEVD